MHVSYSSSNFLLDDFIVCVCGGGGGGEDCITFNGFALNAWRVKMRSLLALDIHIVYLWPNASSFEIDRKYLFTLVYLKAVATVQGSGYSF